jgi:hypothetical protein
MRGMTHGHGAETGRSATPAAGKRCGLWRVPLTADAAQAATSWAHHQVRGPVAPRCLEPELHLTGGVDLDPFVGKRRPCDVADQLLQPLAVVRFHPHCGMQAARPAASGRRDRGGLRLFRVGMTRPRAPASAHRTSDVSFSAVSPRGRPSQPDPARTSERCARRQKSGVQAHAAASPKELAAARRLLPSPTGWEQCRRRFDTRHR